MALNVNCQELAKSKLAEMLSMLSDTTITEECKLVGSFYVNSM